MYVSLQKEKKLKKVINFKSEQDSKEHDIHERKKLES